MSMDELDADRKTLIKQFVFWTAVVVIGGYIVLFVL